MNERILGLDLDGVCANYVDGFRTFCMKEMDRPASDFPDPSSYDFVASGWPFTNLDDYRSWNRLSIEQGQYRNLAPMPGAAEALQELDRNGVHIRIVTHRLVMGGLHRKVVSDTVEWLDMHEIPYKSLCFTGFKDSISAKLHIDDAPHVIEDLRAAGQQVLVFDHAYNRQLEGPRLQCWGPGSVDQILALMDHS